jgi:3',5'-cyclic AMP phosphodiesterase CpdA
MPGSLFAVSDLHVGHAGNQPVVDDLRAESDEDWLIVAGDVADLFADVERTLAALRERFAAVIWAPGNHELWTRPGDPVQLRGDERYQALVRMCRDHDVLTPEDDFPVWSGTGGPVVIAPIFQLYDYSFRTPAASTKAQSLEQAYEAGVVCTDEYLLHPDPFPDLDTWCSHRVALTEKRLTAIDPAMPTVLVSHWPLVRAPTDILYYPEFAQWCGTELTADWHVRFRAELAVYGHLHIPRTTHYDGVRFEEVSLGYPREWGRRGDQPRPMRKLFG